MIKVWEIVGRTVSIILEAGTSKEVYISSLHKISEVKGLMGIVTQTVVSKLAGMRTENPKIKAVFGEMEVGNLRIEKEMKVEK